MNNNSKKKLYEIITEKVYTETIEEIAQRWWKNQKWVMDFKWQVVNWIFLKNYAIEFFKKIKESGLQSIQIWWLESWAIPIIAALSILDTENIIKNSFYIRKSRKKSDLAKRIEWNIVEWIPVILVDDILNSWASIRKQETILFDEFKINITAIFVAVRFHSMEYYNFFTEKNISVLSIFELDDFSDDLPVKNIPKIQEKPYTINKYIITAKIILSKPNLYLVIPKSAPLLDEWYIYIWVDDGNFFCIDKNSGLIKWSYKIKFWTPWKTILSSPITHKDYVFFGAYDGNFYCLNKYTWKVIWIFNDADWIWSSPCINISKGIIYVWLEFGIIRKRWWLVAIDINTWKALWKNYNSMTGYTHASPVYNEKNNMVMCWCNDMYFRSYNAKTGDLLWEYQTNWEIKYGAIFDNKRNIVIFWCMDGGIYILGMANGKLYHKFNALFWFYSTPIQSGSKIFIGSLDKNIYAFDIDRKELFWKSETMGRIFSSPIIDENSLFIGSNDGQLYEINLLDGNIISTIQFPERIVNKIQIERDINNKKILYVPTHACELYRVVEK